jgi:hypothetical protein
MPLIITHTVTMSDDWLTEPVIPTRSVVTNETYTIENEDGCKVTFSNPESVSYWYPNQVPGEQFRRDMSDESFDALCKAYARV